MQPDSSSPLAELWRAGAQRLSETAQAPAGVAAQVTDARHASLRGQWGTVAILAATLAVLCWYFYGYLTVEAGWSPLGKALMLGALGLRIALELVGVALAARIDVLADARAYAAASLRLVRYREAAIRWFAWLGGVAYAAGFGLLVFSYRAYLSAGQVALLLASFAAATAIVGYVIYLSHRDERALLGRLRGLVGELEG